MSQGGLALAGPVCRGHVDGPPREVRPVADLFAQQGVDGNLEGLAHGVEEGHLQPEADGVVPHYFEGVLAPYALDGVFGGFTQRIVEVQCFARADGAALERDAEDFEEGEIWQLSDHIAGGHFAKRQLDGETFKLDNAQIYDESSNVTGTSSGVRSPPRRSGLIS